MGVKLFESKRIFSSLLQIGSVVIAVLMKAT